MKYKINDKVIVIDSGKIGYVTDYIGRCYRVYSHRSGEGGKFLGECYKRELRPFKEGMKRTYTIG